MKKPVVRLKIRVRLPDGSRPFVDPVPSGNGKLKPLYALISGKPQHHPEGCYFLRYADATGKRLWENVGKDWQLAQDAQRKKERALAAEAVGVQVIHDSGKRRIADEVKTYLGEIKAHRSKRTYDAYLLTLTIFQQAATTTYLEDISREDVLAFVQVLRDDECAPRTVFNRVRYLMTFIKRCKLPLPLQKYEYPKYTRKKIRAYNPDELRTLFAAATQEETELYQFFLCTGCRDGEVQHAAWTDFDFARKTFHIEEKLDLSWEPKDREEGSIPLPDYFVEMMRARRARVGGRLIFPDVDGRSRLRYLQHLKMLALNAGLNCGNCADAKGRSCEKYPVCKRWILHRFRKTFATMHRDAGVDLQTIQRWLRHSSLDQTVQYLADSEDQSPTIRGLVNSTFSACLSQQTAPRGSRSEA